MNTHPLPPQVPVALPIAVNTTLVRNTFVLLSLVLGAGAVGAGLGIGTPFAIIGNQLGCTVTIPTGFVGVGQWRGFIVFLGSSPRRIYIISYRSRSVFHFALAFADRRVGLRQAKFLARGLVLGYFQKRVLVEHLLHFLAKLQRGELQQPNGLLQLGRQRQMLRNA